MELSSFIRCVPDFSRSGHLLAMHSLAFTDVCTVACLISVSSSGFWPSLIGPMKLKDIEEVFNLPKYFITEVLYSLLFIGGARF